ELGVEEFVEFTGESFDVPGLLANASLLLLTSRHEGLPTVVLEACAVGTPVLSSDLPGVREIASHLAGVTTLPLAAADETWARALQAATAVPATAASRRAANDAFARSPFRFERWERGLRSAWS
nr:glycosyltransferase [Micromonospora sp. DSM 115978]